MKFEKKFDRYCSSEGFTIALSHSHIKGLYPKYTVCRKGSLEIRRASTLKEAKAIAIDWMKEN